MFASLLLSATLAVAAPAQLQPLVLTDDEKDALDALKKIDFGINDFDDLFPLGTSVGFLHHANAPRPSEADFKPLARLTRLRCVVLEGAPIGGATLDAISMMPNLETLDLNSTRVTDEGMKKLVGLKMLRTLRLKRTQVSDDGMSCLAHLPNLAFLDCTFRDFLYFQLHFPGLS